MTEEQLSQLTSSLTEAVAKQMVVTVNGKLDKLTEKINSLSADVSEQKDALIAHAQSDELSHKTVTDYIEDDYKWKEKAEPVIKLGENITWSTMALLKVLGVIVAVCSIAATIYSFAKKTP